MANNIRRCFIHGQDSVYTCEASTVGVEISLQHGQYGPMSTTHEQSQE